MWVSSHLLGSGPNALGIIGPWRIIRHGFSPWSECGELSVELVSRRSPEGMIRRCHLISPPRLRH